MERDVHTYLQCVYLQFSVKFVGDFPGGPVIQSPHCNAGGAGPTPGQGNKVPHALVL